MNGPYRIACPPLPEPPPPPPPWWCEERRDIYTGWFVYTWIGTNAFALAVGMLQWTIALVTR